MLDEYYRNYRTTFIVFHRCLDTASLCCIQTTMKNYKLSNDVKDSPKEIDFFSNWSKRLQIFRVLV